MVASSPTRLFDNARASLVLRMLRLFIVILVESREAEGRLL